MEAGFDDCFGRRPCSRSRLKGKTRVASRLRHLLERKLIDPIQSDKKGREILFSPHPLHSLFYRSNTLYTLVEMSTEQKYAGDLESSRDGKDVHPNSPHDLPALGHTASYDKATAHITQDDLHVAGMYYP